MGRVAHGAVLETHERERSDQPPRYPTTAEVVHPGDRRVRRGRVIRRLFTALLVAFVVAAAAGVFGVRTRTVRATRGDLSVRLHYSAVNRRGVTSAWELVVQRLGGFDNAVRVRVSSRYLDTLDLRGVAPEPAASTTDAAMTEYTFTRPRSSTLTMRIDSEVDPGASPGRHRGIAIVRTGDAPPLTLHFLTWVLP